MIIECQNCKRKFKVDESRITTPRVRARCSKCSHVFFIERSESSISSENARASNEQHESAQPESLEEITESQRGTSKVTEHPRAGIYTQENKELRENKEKDFKWVIPDADEALAERTLKLPKMFEDESNENVDHGEESAENDNEGTRASEGMYSPSEIRGFSPPSPKEELPIDYHNPAMAALGYSAGIFFKIAFALSTLLVLVVIIASTLSILDNLGFLSKGWSDTIKNSTKLIIPIEFFEEPKNDITIAEYRGRWLQTVNGPLFVVSGKIINRREYPVHYVKLKTEFTSVGNKLFENVTYAGNTFTEDELTAMTTKEILLRLKRKNGDISYVSPKKLAGLNYNIESGESIPFFAVFPSEIRLLGLRYKPRVIDYENSLAR